MGKNGMIIEGICTSRKISKKPLSEPSNIFKILIIKHINY